MERGVRKSTRICVAVALEKRGGRATEWKV